MRVWIFEKPDFSTSRGLNMIVKATVEAYKNCEVSYPVDREVASYAVARSLGIFCKYPNAAGQRVVNPISALRVYPTVMGVLAKVDLKFRRFPNFESYCEEATKIYLQASSLPIIAEDVQATVTILCAIRHETEPLGTRLTPYQDELFQQVQKAYSRDVPEHACKDLNSSMMNPELASSMLLSKSLNFKSLVYHVLGLHTENAFEDLLRPWALWDGDKASLTKKQLFAKLWQYKWVEGINDVEEWEDVRCVVVVDGGRALSDRELLILPQVEVTYIILDHIKLQDSRGVFATGLDIEGLDAAASSLYPAAWEFSAVASISTLHPTRQFAPTTVLPMDWVNGYEW